MAIDFKALKAKLQNNSKNGRADILWKPAEGENVIRIVPYAENPSNPLIELKFYYNMFGKTYFSPSSIGQRDPILEAGEALIAEGGMSKDEYKHVKQTFFPQLRSYVPIIDRAKPEEGVKFWAFGKTVYDTLLALLADEDEYGDITDVKEGRNLIVDYIPQEKSKTNYAQTAVRVAGKPTPLGKPAEVEKWLKDQPDLIASFTVPTTQTLEDLLERLTSPVSETSTEEVEELPVNNDEWGESPTAAKAKTAPKKEAADVEHEFDAMFNNTKDSE